MRTIILTLTDEHAEYLLSLAEVGLHTMEDFNITDHDVWGTHYLDLGVAREIIKELRDSIVYDYVMTWIQILDKIHGMEP